jgi:hypothetical protein
VPVVSRKTSHQKYLLKLPMILRFGKLKARDWLAMNGYVLDGWGDFKHFGRDDDFTRHLRHLLHYYRKLEFLARRRFFQ